MIGQVNPISKSVGGLMTKIDSLVQDFLAQMRIAVAGVSDKRDPPDKMPNLRPRFVMTGCEHLRSPSLRAERLP